MQAKAAIADDVNQRLLRLNGWLRWSERISGMRKRAGGSIRAFEFFDDLLLELRRFLNPIFALQCPQIPQTFVAFKSTISISSLIRVGVRKTSRLSFSICRLWNLNSQPKNGISPREGLFVR